MRKKMNQIIKWLETDDFDVHKEDILSDKYSKALKTLIDTGCVQAHKAWGGTILRLTLLDHSATYQLERRDVWSNRIWGFVVGIITGTASSVLAALITGLLPM